ncbi:MAG: EAL domain-containing protein [Pseudomonadales bacterium]|nr:EAL domain-containing protein [Pseudomonadales bacterium]
MIKQNFKRRLQVWFIGLVFVTLAIFLLSVWGATNNHIVSTAEKELAVSERVFSRLLDLRGRQLTTSATVLADDFGFKQAIATEDRDTVLSALINHGDRIGTEMIVLLSPAGTVLESSHAIDASENLLARMQLQNQASVSGAALESENSSQAEPPQEAYDLIVAENSIFQIVFVPVKAPNLIAWVGLGFAIDDELAQSLKSVTGADITFINHPEKQPATLLVSTLTERLQEMLRAVIAKPEFNDATVDLKDRVRSFLNIALADEAIISQAVDAQQLGAGQIDILLTASLQTALEGFIPLKLQMLTIAVLALAGSILLISFIAKSVHKPIQHLVQVALRMSRGDYSHVFETPRNDEFGTLATTLNQMQEAIIDRERRILYQSQHDWLTNLPNRQLIGDKVLERIARAPEDPFVLMVLNVNNFRQFQDTFGENLSDEILIQVGMRLQRISGYEETVARFEGDQFVLLLEELVEAELQSEGQKLLSYMTEPYICEKTELNLNFTIGAAIYPDHGKNKDDLFRRANIAIKRAHTGQGAVSVYQEGEDERHLREINISNYLHDALDNDKFTLFFQPKYCLKQKRVTQVEALLRWTHEELGFISPEEFIPIAEQSGNIGRLTQWVFRQVLRQIRIWQDMELNIGIAMNLSAADLLNENLPHQFISYLREQRIDASYLTLEITESAVMLDPERALESLNILRDFGIKLAIDDYGTGYSSLAQIKRFPVDELKIDKSFVLRLDQNADDAIIVRSTIELGHNLGLKVVAEGVENQESVKILETLGCDTLQGYYISRPVPAEVFEKWVVDYELSTEV